MDSAYRRGIHDLGLDISDAGMTSPLGAAAQSTGAANRRISLEITFRTALVCAFTTRLAPISPHRGDNLFGHRGVHLETVGDRLGSLAHRVGDIGNRQQFTALFLKRDCDHVGLLACFAALGLVQAFGPSRIVLDVVHRFDRRSHLGTLGIGFIPTVGAPRRAARCPRRAS